MYHAVVKGNQALRQSLAVAGSAVVLLSAAAHAGAVQITQIKAYDYSPTTGQLIKEIIEPASSDLCLVSTYVYDPFGNKWQVTQRNCNGSGSTFPGSTTIEAAAPSSNPIAPRVETKQYSYNTDGSVTVVSTNAGGEVQTASFNVGFGSLADQRGPNVLTDVNGNVVYDQWAYDGLGRKVLHRTPDGNGVRTRYELCSVAACPSVGSISPVYAITSTPVTGPIDLVTKTTGAANGPYSKTYYDALDRPIRTEAPSSDVSGTSTLIYQDTQYDALGRVASVSAPYFVSAPYAGGATKYGYDNWGRAILVTAPDNSKTTIAYAGLITTFTNDLLQTTTKVRDVLGKTIQVVDNNGKSLFLGYDPVGELLQSTDSAGNTVTMHYDVRGRKKDMQDPDLGSWTYGYDAVGNLTSQTDARLQVTYMTYDKLNRLVGKAEPTQNATWVYSSCPQGIGQLCEASTTTGYDRKQSYDRLSRVASETVMIGASSYSSGIDYDSVTGRVLHVRYPTALQLTNVYTSLGFLQKMVNTSSGASYWQANMVDARGNVTQQTYGNNVSSVNSYDPLTGRLKSTTAGAGNAVQNIAYTYDTLGNLRTRNDLLTGVNASYSYDNLNRLQTETRSGGGLASEQTIVWGYSDIGNIASRSDVGSYAYNPSGANSIQPHAVASIAGTVNGVINPGYLYDGNGNLFSVSAGGGSQTAAWNSFNKVSTLTRTFAGHTNQLDFLYDADQERAREVYTRDGTVQRTTVYLNPSEGAGLFYEEENGVAGVKRRHYITAGGQTIGMLVLDGNNNLSATQYWHKDHLSSLMVVTDANGVVVERLAYEPFGKRRNANGTTDANGTLVPASTARGYTEHEGLDEVALINMNGRIYDPAISRFLSPDPTVPAPDFMQSYNRYSYAVNAPVNRFDPSGYDDEAAPTIAPASDTPAISLPNTLVSALYSYNPALSTYYSPNYLNGTTPLFTSASDFSANYIYGNYGSTFNSNTYGIPSFQSDAAKGAAPDFCCSGPFGTRSTSEIGQKFWYDLSNDPLITRTAGSFGALTMWSIGQVTGDQGAINGSLDWMRSLGSAGDGVQMAMGLGLGGRVKAGVPGSEFAPSEAVTGPYVRPSGAGPTAAQRASVQGQPCVDCGALTSRQIADHKDPLVVQHYRTGSVDVQQQRSIDAVQPHCPPCSAAQGGQLSVFSRLMKDYFGF